MWALAARAPGSMEVIASRDAMPVTTRSTGPHSSEIFAIATESTEAVVITSEPSRNSSETRKARSAPICRARMSASSASSGPMVRAMTSASRPASSSLSLSWTAASMAFSSSSLSTSSSPRTRRPPSKRRSDCMSGTCFTHTTILMASSVPHSWPLAHMRVTSPAHTTVRARGTLLCVRTFYAPSHRTFSPTIRPPCCRSRMIGGNYI